MAKEFIDKIQPVSIKNGGDMARKCKCGARVHDNDTEAVRVYDKNRKVLKRVVCSGCASGRPPKIKDDVYRKRKEEGWGTYKRKVLDHVDAAIAEC